MKQAVLNMVLLVVGANSPTRADDVPQDEQLQFFEKKIRHFSLITTKILQTLAFS